MVTELERKHEVSKSYSFQLSFEDEFGKRKINVANLVEAYLRTHEVIRLGKVYFIYDPDIGIWSKFEEVEMKREIFQLLSKLEQRLWIPSIGAKVLELLNMYVPSQKPDMKGTENLVCLENCIVNIASGKKRAFSSKYFFTSKCDYKYEKTAECPTFLKYLDVVTDGNEKLKATLVEILGYSMSMSTEGHVSFYLLGAGNNGKSVFCDILSELVGANNYVSLTHSELEKPFSRLELDGKKVLLIPDLSRKDSTSLMTAEVKKIIVGDLYSAEKKFGEHRTLRSTVKVVCSSNFRPSFIFDNTTGGKRRLLIIPFNHYITDEEKDTKLFEKLKKERSGIFNMAISAYQELRKRKFKFSYTGEDIKRQIELEESPFECFVSENIEYSPYSFAPYASIKESYGKWCNENQIAISPPTSKQIETILSSRYLVKRDKRNGKRGLIGINIK